MASRRGRCRMTGRSVLLFAHLLPALVLGTLLRVRIFFAFQPESHPIDIALLRFEPLERKLVNV